MARDEDGKIEGRDLCERKRERDEVEEREGRMGMACAGKEALRGEWVERREEKQGQREIDRQTDRWIDREGGRRWKVRLEKERGRGKGKDSEGDGGEKEGAGVGGAWCGCRYGFQEEREGERGEQRVVGALLIPVCADWAKRGASGSARERDGAMAGRRRGGEKENPPIADRY